MVFANTDTFGKIFLFCFVIIMLMLSTSPSPFIFKVFSVSDNSEHISLTNSRLSCTVHILCSQGLLFYGIYIYILYIRSLLEQSCTVWHSGLTAENSEDLERVQKSSLKIILKEKFQSYEHALSLLDLDSLAERREILCLQFAKKLLRRKLRNI